MTAAAALLRKINRTNWWRVRLSNREHAWKLWRTTNGA